MSHTTGPQLAAPGAGLPAIELFIGARIFALKRWLGNRVTSTKSFEQERAAIRSLVNSCEPGKRAERVLIPRLRGLEDSSRFWSVWMTLDHLRITNSAFATVITSLASGKVPEKPASTAEVKPDPTVSAAVENRYEESCDELLCAVAAVPNLRTTAKYAHPWFGPLDAAGWHTMTGMHMSIHHAQIARIVSALPSHRESINQSSRSDAANGSW
jgi:hypothetical protein